MSERYLRLDKLGGHTPTDPEPGAKTGPVPTETAERSRNQQLWPTAPKGVQRPFKYPHVHPPERLRPSAAQGGVEFNDVERPLPCRRTSHQPTRLLDVGSKKPQHPTSAMGILVQLCHLLDWDVRDTDHPRHFPHPTLVGT
ncbi:hypothetical protein C7435_3375 [Maricaulis maris]|uniref:Uncharacterized protein n=1 Tax=Maricaulis maris TaxID=74318 RepID=A0A495CW66_9PROT|nr:hypothetical protein C7435_3375 [Maricaulis maris]